MNLSKSKFFKELLTLFIFSVLFFIFGLVSIKYTALNENVSILWIPNSIAIALILFSKNKKNYLAIMLVSILFELYTYKLSLFQSFIISVGTCLEVFFAISLFNVFYKKLKSVLNYQTCLIIFPLISLIAPLVSSIFGAYAVCSLGPQKMDIFLPVFIDWYLGNVLGLFLGFPLVMALMNKSIKWTDSIAPICIILLAVVFRSESAHAYIFFLIFLYLVPIHFKSEIGILLVSLFCAFMLMWQKTQGIDAIHFQIGHYSLLSSQIFLYGLGLISCTLIGYSGTEYLNKSKKILGTIFFIFSLSYAFGIYQNDDDNFKNYQNLQEKLISNSNDKFDILSNSLKSISGVVKTTKKLDQDNWNSYAQTVNLNEHLSIIDSYGVIFGKSADEIDESFAYPITSDIYIRSILRDENVKKLLNFIGSESYPRMSKRIFLSSSDNLISKSLLILPIKKNGLNTGWAYCLIDNSELFLNITPQNSQYLFEVNETNDLGISSRIYSPKEKTAQTIFQKSKFIFADHLYSLNWKLNKNYKDSSTNYFIYFYFLLNLLLILTIIYLINIKIQKTADLELNRLLKTKVSETEERFQTIFKAASDGIIVFNLENVIEANPQFYTIFQLKNDDVSKIRILDLFPTFQENSIKTSILLQEKMEVVNLEGHAQFEIVCQRNKVDFNAEIKIDKFKLNEVVFYIASIVDISIRKKTERSLIAATNNAKETAKAKTRFLSNMSHEIRTPLNGILGIVGLLLAHKENENLNQEQIENLKVVEFSANSLIKILNEILDFSKIESNNIVLEIRNIELKNLMKNLSKLYNENCKKKKIDLVLDYDPLIPPHLMLDELRNGQIINNLVSNAVKFTEIGQITIKLKLQKIEFNKATIQFTIKDTGIGIPQNKIASIFQEFTQANDNHSRIYGGTGLGLSIAKKLIELQGGKIEVNSTENIGTEMYYNLIFDIANDPAELLILKNSEEVPELSFKNLKVLLVEDNDINIFVAKRFLNKWDMNIIVAKNGIEAVEMAQKEVFDIILMDFHMPLMDGIEATKQIRNLNISTPIIGLSADVISDIKEDFLAYGMNDFISKPFKANELAFKINKILKS